MHGGDIYRNEVEYDFSVNLNPAGVPRAVTTALEEALTHISEYPDIEYQALRQDLAEFWEVSADRILLGNGASELIASAILALQPKSCLITAPAYTGYEHILRQVLPECVIHYGMLREENGFRVGEALLQDIRSQKPELLILTNPNNPNGRLIDSRMLDGILQVAREEGTILLMDECFLALTGQDEARSLIHRNPETLPETIVLRAFTKTFAIPGVRLGYAVTTSAALAARVSVPLPEWNLSVFAEKAGAACLRCASETDYMPKSQAMIARERDDLAQGLRALGYTVFPSDANYILFRTPDANASSLPEAGNLLPKLLSKGILIRSCGDFQGLTKEYYRVAVMDRERNQKLLRALQEITAGK